jgi:hypothetical protein
MRRTALVVLPVALIVLAALSSRTLPAPIPSSTWRTNETRKPFVTAKWKLEDRTGGTFAFYNTDTITITLSSLNAGFFGDVAANLPGAFVAPLNTGFFAGDKSTAGMYGGKYAFAGFDESNAQTIGYFRNAVYACLLQLDSALPAGYPGRLGGEVDPVSVVAKGAGKTKADADNLHCSGKFKIAFTATISGGPKAGLDVKGSLSFAFGSATRSTGP